MNLKFIKDLKNGSVMSLTATNEYFHQKINLSDENGKKVPLNAPNIITIIGADDKYIYIQDPHYPERKLHTKAEKLLNCLNGAVIVKLNENHKQ